MGKCIIRLCRQYGAQLINNGWCVQIRGPQAGGLIEDLPIHMYDLGTGNQMKIPTEVLIPETREFEFANLALFRCLL